MPRQLMGQVVATVELDLLQFSGDESATFCRSFGKPYLKGKNAPGD